MSGGGGRGPESIWLRLALCMKLNWREIHHVQESTLESVLRQHTEVFQRALGTLKGYWVKIHIDPDVQPQSVPSSMQVKVEEKPFCKCCWRRIQEIVVISTHHVLFCYNRLPYSLSLTPGIFQRVMESLLQGILVLSCTWMTSL